MLPSLAEPTINMITPTPKVRPGRLSTCLAVFLGLTLLPIYGASAQAETHKINEYWRPGFPTVTVNVMGSVGQAGLWKIERDLDFIEFASVLNIAKFDAGRDRVITTVRIYRGPATSRALVYEAELKDILESVVPYPKLIDADLLVVEQEATGRGITFRTVTSTIAAIGSIILLTLRIVDRT